MNEVVYREGFELGDAVDWVNTTAWGNGAFTVYDRTSGIVRSGNCCYGVKTASGHRVMTKSTLTLDRIFNTAKLRFGMLITSYNWQNSSGLNYIGHSPILQFVLGATPTASLLLHSQTGRLAFCPRTTEFSETNDLNWNNRIVAWSTIALSPNSYYLIEIEPILSSAGSFVVKVDGEIVIDYTGSTRGVSSDGFDAISLCSTPLANGGCIYFDDIGLNSEDWCGPGGIIALFPNGDGDISEGVDQDGNTVNTWQALQSGGHVDLQPGTAQYYHVEDFPVSDQTVVLRWDEFRAIGLTPGSVMRIGHKGVGTYLTPVVLPGSPTKRLLSAFETVNPDTNQPYTVAEINGQQIVAKVDDDDEGDEE